jgi:lipid-A-disaccharide synthase
MSLSVFILAVENSGDHLGAGLATALKAALPDIRLSGIGGQALKNVGISSDFNISRLSILGFTEAISAYPHILERVKTASEMIMAQQPDAVVLVDSWGFMVRVAKRLKALGYRGKIVKYVAPQVWAMRAGRANILARHVDYLLSIQPMDAPFFNAVGLANDYVGNPMFDVDYSGGDGAGLRGAYDIPKGAPVIGVFFGSRLSELHSLAQPFADTIERVKAVRPDVHFIAPMAASIDDDILAAAGQDLRLQEIILLPEARKQDVFAACDIALACSGTVTTQLASVGVPTIVAYKLSALTFFAAKRLYRPKYISLVNIAANEALMPEFMQGDVNGTMLGQALLTRLENAALRRCETRALLKQTMTMRQNKSGLASHQAAEKLLTYLTA